MVFHKRKSVRLEEKFTLLAIFTLVPCRLFAHHSSLFSLPAFQPVLASN